MKWLMLFTENLGSLLFVHYQKSSCGDFVKNFFGDGSDVTGVIKFLLRRHTVSEPLMNLILSFITF